MGGTRIDESIFKAYDIRGVYPGQINEEAAYRIGRAFVSFRGCSNVVVGRDARQSSPVIHESLVKGITDQGADVIDIGLSTTPMFYFSIANYGHDSGIMITASHNPKDYNGLKLCREKAIPIGGETGMEEIKKLAVENNFEEPSRKGGVSGKKPLDDYAKKVLSFAEEIKRSRKLRLVVDAGNGMSPVVFPKIEEALPIEAEKLCFEVDCSFPNHEANPSKEETTEELKSRVRGGKADMGIAFDGDADRIGFVDENGRLVPSDLITALLAEEFLEKNPGEKILYEVRSTWAVRDTIKEKGGIPVLWKAGHALIKEKMRKDDILFGGEKSGHCFYRDFWYADSAMITMVKVLNVLSKKGCGLSEALKPFEKYYSSEEINFRIEDKDKVIRGVEESLKQEAVNIMHVDGLTMEFKGWWFNLRKSNTEPLLRLNMEADTEDGLKRARERMEKLIGGLR